MTDKSELLIAVLSWLLIEVDPDRETAGAVF